MTFRDHVVAHELLLLDGGLGSALIARGLPRGTPPELWNLERGEEVNDVHRSYVAAGSDAVQTNTFGANLIRLEAYGIAGRCGEINRAAVELARAASPRFVIGDVGPTGEYLPPVGKGDVSRWHAAFECQAEALADAGVDAFHVETMSDLREAMVALDVLRAVAPEIPIMISMTFERKKRGFFTVMGDPLVSSLNELAAMGATAVGANCGVASAEMMDLVDEALAGVDAPLAIQPNAGAPRTTPDRGVRYDQPPEEFADDMATIAARGVAIIGGCCGTDDRFIASLSRRLRRGSGSS